MASNPAFAMPKIQTSKVLKTFEVIFTELTVKPSNLLIPPIAWMWKHSRTTRNLDRNYGFTSSNLYYSSLHLHLQSTKGEAFVCVSNTPSVSEFRCPVRFAGRKKGVERKATRINETHANFKSGDCRTPHWKSAVEPIQ